VNTPPGAKLPTVVWLHGYSYPLGYMWVYRRDLHPILALTQAGYAVLAYDQCGFGNRQTEIGPFFKDSPNWSQMGRLVHDARSAVDALAKDEVVDPKRIYLYGYELGATAALYTAALDPRVQGVVSVCGFTPMRTDTADRGTGGIARWSVERPLLPRLGFFIGHESQIPVDFPEIIAAIAPRPVVIVAPQLDRDANSADVHAALTEVRKVYALYNAAPDLMVDEPWDYARLPAYTQDWTIQSLNWAAHNPPPAPAAPTAAN
jgi:pimeloyl-ACP methyl ester carboxylesterase